MNKSIIMIMVPEEDKKDGDEHDVEGILFAYIHVEDDVEERLAIGFDGRWAIIGACLQKTIDRYKAYTRENVNYKAVQQDIQQVKADALSLANRLEALEKSKRKFLGENLEDCSVEELHSLEVKLEKSLHVIRGKKTQLLEQQIAKLKEKERTLLKDNKELREKQRNLQLPLVSPVPNRCLPPWPRNLPAPPCDDSMDVETELYIGLPGRERSSNRDSG
nr:unnamed protein product [Digitaria exilis]